MNDVFKNGSVFLYNYQASQMHLILKVFVKTLRPSDKRLLQLELAWTLLSLDRGINQTRWMMLAWILKWKRR